ncbi:MAG TPA: DUF5686 family protein [Candidatus Kapabacteria bacterium]|nr:DUF5686 family protein [Candidatus Kapabacteria bacterium]
MKPILLALLFLLVPATAATAQDAARTVVTGVVTDSAGGAPLRFVTVRAVGTTIGGMTNSAGRFAIRLPRGEHTLEFSLVGYATVRCDVSARGDTVRFDLELRPAAVRGAEVVVSAEDPGVKLMRRVLARKAAQRDSLRTYSYMLYTKFVAATDTLTAGRTDAPRDTTIVSIFESYSRGYFRAPGDYFNEIVQRRQSANVPPQSNFVAFGTNLNAYDDIVTILGEEIATPFHPSALDYYDFVLERTTDAAGTPRIARVRVEPKGNARRLFTGWVNIDMDRLVPVSVELAPNRAVRLPFDAALSYDQRFEEVDGRFVVPTGMRIYSSLRAELLWLIAPRLDVTIETVAYDYHCNIPLDNSLFEQRRVEVSPEAERFDSSYWFDRAVLPLRPIEAEAYDAIQRARDNPDSVNGTSLIGQFFTDLTRQVARFNRRPFTGLDDIVRYNRVNGAYLGLGLRDDILPWLEGSLLGGYGFADRHGYAQAGLKAYLDGDRRVSLGATAYSTLARRDNPYVVGTGAITTLALLTRNDYGDYYYASGGEAAFQIGFGQLQFIRRDQFERPSTLRFFVRQEQQRSAGVHAGFSLFGGSAPFRDNPPIVPGTMRSAGMEFNWNYNPLRRFSRFGFHLAAEFADPKYLGGDFRFEQFEGAMHLRMSTLPLWRLDLRASGGYSVGAVPAQKFFSLESAFSSTASEGVFHAMHVKEFYGDRFAALSLEHNFGEVIPGVLRIPNIASFGIEFIVLANIGWSGFSHDAVFASDSSGRYSLPSTDATRDRFYYEAGIGLNRVLLFFRVDVTGRFSQVDRPHFSFTISGGP